MELRLGTLLATSALVLASCTAPGGPDSFKGSEFGNRPAPPIDATMATTIPDAGVTAKTTPLACAPVHSSQALPARTTITSGMDTSSAPKTYFTSDLFTFFKTVCGGCHVESNLGMFVVSAETFTAVVDQKAIGRITTTDMTLSMPPQGPGGIPYAMRSATDPVVQLAELLQTWIMQGRPASSFTLASDPGGAMASADFALTPDLGGALTNIGNCVPAGTIGQNETTMDALDAFFAAASTLPDTLAETDLTTLDNMTLAANGVISYAPTYPLFSDNSGKMRYVRVPRGQSIAFDKATQKFHIPDNTRFYKTFLKKVVDGEGQETYRKIETRIIVARGDTDAPAGSTAETIQNALFGTYVWNDDESNAVLLQDPLRNGKPFRDRVVSYFTDEMKAQAIIDAAPADLEAALDAVPGLKRHYALPGSDRCVACHMGSPSADFVLGFTPLQVNRRPIGTGGVFEPATGDELTQLQRLIDYGVISGMTSPADVVPLEKSEGGRAPRNDYELTAQAYMVGNCAHCHNPRGFPTKKAPVLKDVLNFLPSADGGVFQFPLERTSPVRARGPNQNTPIPYITPSLYDFPTPGFHGKWLDCVTDDIRELCPGPDKVYITAPWRSLIYRNVDTPFDYVDDFTIFPHMPMNSAGYDCRAPRIMGDWMTSIPANLVHTDKVERGFWGKTQLYQTNINNDPQPYVEVAPGDPKYDVAVSFAANRMDSYHAGHRYDYCADSTDILDPWIIDLENQNYTVTIDNADVTDPADELKILWPFIGVPMKPHWVVSDTTDPPGAWNPRRPDWAPALLAGQVGDTSTLPVEDAKTLRNVVESLKTAKLTPDIKAVLTAKVPVGLWKQKAGCNFSGVPTVSSFQGSSRPLWMDVAGAPSTAPVYEETLGGAVFNTICFNCHGPQANAQGLLADEIAIMTGGDARVANFREGLLGPMASPGMNRLPVFVDPSSALGTDDISARYVAWMALGGTLKHIPAQLLDLVSNTPVFGTFRNTRRIDPVGTPDMLKLGLELCTHMLPANQNAQVLAMSDFFLKGRFDWAGQTALIDSTGDAEMWLRLCTLGNRPVVRVPQVNWTATTQAGDISIFGATSLYWGDGDASGPSYPAGTPVMNHRAQVVSGIDANNLFPLCIRKPSDPQELTYADQFLSANHVGGPSGAVIPYCPPELFAVDPVSHKDKFLLASSFDNGYTDYPDGQKWAARGAISAGMAVFVYLDQLERGQVAAPPSYDQCETLAGAGH